MIESDMFGEFQRSPAIATTAPACRMRAAPKGITAIAKALTTRLLGCKSGKVQGLKLEEESGCGWGWNWIYYSVFWRGGRSEVWEKVEMAGLSA